MQTILTNFALILFVAMVVTGVIWCVDVFYLAKQRRKAADAEAGTAPVVPVVQAAVSAPSAVPGAAP